MKHKQLYRMGSCPQCFGSTQLQGRFGGHLQPNFAGSDFLAVGSNQSVELSDSD